MAHFSKIDLSLVCLRLAEEARGRADRADDPDAQQVWTDIAADWELLARLRGERCICGGPAIGSKHFDRGGRVPLCGKHLGEEIANRTLTRLGFKRLN
jgi:hypothetical protein